MFLEISKNYVKKFYNGNLKSAIQNHDGILWNDDRIKKSFNFGKGTIKDFENYKHNNLQYCYFVKI